MAKKKAIKLAAASAVAASAFVAAAPAQTDAASNVAVEVSKAVTQMKKAYHTYSDVTAQGKFAPIADVYKEYNVAKKAYANAKAVVTKAGGSAKEAYLAQLDATYNEYIAKRVVTYIDAFNYATALEDKKEALEAALEEKEWEKAEELYHEISYELNTRTVILHRVYGQTARNLLVDAFKVEAQDTRDSITNEVSVKMYYDKAKDLVAEGKLEDAKKAMDHVADYVAKLDKDTDFGAYLLTQVSEVKAAYEAKLAPAVESVSAINAKQLVVTFNQPVLGETADVANDATDVANYTLGANNANAAVLSADKRSVTVTFNGGVEGQDQVLVVNPVATSKKDANGATVSTEKYSKVFSFEDTVKPQVTGTSYDNGKIIVSFSEAIGTEPAVVRVNGVPVPASSYEVSSSDATKVEITHSLAAGATASLYVAGAKDASTAQNEMSLFNGSVIAPSADTAKPSITSVQVTGQNTAKVTLSEAITQTSVNAKLQKGATQSDVTLVKDTTDTTGKTYTLTVDLNGATAGDGIFSGTSTSETFTLFVAAGAMSDTSSPANTNDLFSTSLTFNKDVNGPALATSKVATDNKKFELKFDENLIVAGSVANLTVKNSEGVKISADADETVLKSGDASVYLVDIKDGDVAFDAGTYTVSIPAGYFTDQYGNPSAAVTSTFTVGAPSNADTTKPTATVTNVSGTANAFQVVYSEEVTASALNLANYKLDGSALPAGTEIYFTSTAKTTVQIVLPENSINIGNQTTGASAILNVSGVADKAGNVINSANTAVVVKDNTAATITNVQVIGQDVYVTFNENVTFDSVAGVDANDALDIKVSNVVVEAGDLAVVAGNAKQVKFTLDAAPATAPVVTVKANQTLLTDANGVPVK